MSSNILCSKFMREWICETRMKSKVVSYHRDTCIIFHLENINSVNVVNLYDQALTQNYAWMKRQDINCEVLGSRDDTDECMTL
jgi:hypothetical protein